jgi:hypothetical protein
MGDGREEAANLLVPRAPVEPWDALDTGRQPRHLGGPAAHLLTEVSMPAASETVRRRWFDEVWTQKRLDSIDELFAPHGVAYGLAEGGADDVEDTVVQGGMNRQLGAEPMVAKLMAT